MAPEVWFRNPHTYIRELVEQHAELVAWDRGFLVKKRIDPERFGNLYYPASADYRMLMVGHQGTAEVRRGRGVDNPVAVYPTWTYGDDDLATLEDMLAHPLGDDRRACANRSLPADERPVFGQEHRVVVSDLPSAVTGVGRKFYAVLREMQADYPDAILHVHGLYSYRVAFGNGYGAVDIEARTLASKGKVTLPNGKEVTYEQAAKWAQWVTVCGFTLAELEVPRNRCMFNIRSAWWAAEHYLENHRFRVKGAMPVSPDDPDPAPSTVNGVQSRQVTPMVGDKFDCDTCSLQATCKYFRTGNVCSLPDSDASKLAAHFRTRDSGIIMDGLGVLMEKQAERLVRGLQDEAADGELNAEVTRILDGMFAKGVTLAKLVDPSLRTAPKVNVGVQVNGGQAAITGGTPQELASQAVQALESQGYTRDEMTTELIEGVMQGKPIPVKQRGKPIPVKQRAIEATASG